MAWSSQVLRRAWTSDGVLPRREARLRVSHPERVDYSRTHGSSLTGGMPLRFEIYKEGRMQKNRAQHLTQEEEVDEAAGSLRVDHAERMDDW